MFTAGTCEEYPNKRSLNNPKLILSQAGNAQVSASGDEKFMDMYKYIWNFSKKKKKKKKNIFRSANINEQETCSAEHTLQIVYAFLLASCPHGLFLSSRLSWSLKERRERPFQFSFHSRRMRIVKMKTLATVAVIFVLGICNCANGQSHPTVWHREQRVKTISAARYLIHSSTFRFSRERTPTKFLSTPIAWCQRLRTGSWM